MNVTDVEIFVPYVYCNYGLKNPKQQTQKPHQTFRKTFHSLRPFSRNIPGCLLGFSFYIQFSKVIVYASEAVGFVHNEGIFLEMKYEYSTFQAIYFFGYWKIKLEVQNICI